MIRKLLVNLDDILACLVLTAIVAVTVLAVVMRYLVHAPLPWVEELQLALYLWAIMLGAVSAMKRRKHVGIDVFVNLLPASARRLVLYWNDALSIVVLLSFAWLGLMLAEGAGEKITPILGIRYRWIDMAIPVGSLLMVLQLVVNLCYRDKRMGESS
ncbi:Neu5Ac permease [Serratia quinivorans]|jgi:C4-dicarboxylate transporter, DctQ subunit|uniref:TRAP transporter small permease protein n=1 Tax=Serratia quinivorans TaxID=137545 RepID=A0ABV3UMZ8_9GAMM|nr:MULTISPECIES: TRAP transporter small permease [Serratia]QBX67804.1 TRAP transporter small permease [Serratia quinivorans]CAI1173460.1 Neu5Ac permease [Serratia quinivorans]CAI1936315.1 Neu5Ac permease [Serratia quinivorans]CAI1961761.1 Neu5Ac permease [Serratia quinivorans]CAI2021564.1 Neu5Ac permease [Serratia quinivorans]